MNDDPQDAPPHPHPGGECQLCPVCVVLQVLADGRPEVSVHLRAAGRELGRALQALLDGGEPEDSSPSADPAGDRRLHRIRVE